MNHNVLDYSQSRATGRLARLTRIQQLPSARAFTLVEMIVAMAVLSVLVLMISSIFQQAQRGWIAAQNRAECYAEGRKILDGMVNDLQQAVARNGKSFFKGATDEMSMVASVNQSSHESADLCEVGYKYDAATRRLVRRYTGPIGAQPGASSGTIPPTFQAMSLGSLTPPGSLHGEMSRLGEHFTVNQTIYLTEVGIVDHNLDGQLTHAENPPEYWSMVLMQKNGSAFTLFNSWEMTKNGMQASSPPGYMFHIVSTTGIALPPGEYKLYTTFFCSGGHPYNAAWDKVLTGSSVFNANSGILSYVSSVYKWQGCWNYTVADPTSVNNGYQTVNFRYRLQQTGGSSSGTGLTVNDQYAPSGVTTTGTWDIYDTGWDDDDSWDTNETLASNTVTAVSFEYGTNLETLGSSYSTAGALPNVVRVSVSLIDRRAAEAVSAGSDVSEMTSRWGHTFSTVIHLPNAIH